ncbi:MAG: lysophospholipid acyltransferase family protein [Phycisphaerae bacterium]
MNLESVRHLYLRRIVAPVLRGLGVRLSTGFARRLSRGVFEMNGAGRRRAESRLRAALPNATDDEIRAIAAASYEHIARFWIEALFIPRRLGDVANRSRVRCADYDDRNTVRTADPTDLHALASSGRGCLLAAAYHGNLAAGACLLGDIFRPIYVVVDFLAQPVLASWQRELYAQPHVRPIERSAVAVRMPRILSEGGAVLMVAEHERAHGRAVETRFLGRPLRCYPTLGRLARWYNVPIGVVTCRREETPFSFRLDLHDVVEARTLDDDETIVRQVMAVLESAIMQSPEQYLWSMPTEVSIEHDSEPRSIRAAPVRKRSALKGSSPLILDRTAPSRSRR